MNSRWLSIKLKDEYESSRSFMINEDYCCNLCSNVSNFISILSSELEVFEVIKKEFLFIVEERESVSILCEARVHAWLLGIVYVAASSEVHTQGCTKLVLSGDGKVTNPSLVVLLEVRWNLRNWSGNSSNCLEWIDSEILFSWLSHI